MIESTTFGSPAGIGAIHELIVSSPPIIELPASRHGRCQFFLYLFPCVKWRLQRSWKEQTKCDVLAQLFHSITMIQDVAIYVVLNHGMITSQ